MAGLGLFESETAVKQLAPEQALEMGEVDQKMLAVVGDQQV